MSFDSPEPSEPEQSSTKQDVRDIMRLYWCHVRVLAEPIRQHDGRHTGCSLDDRAACSALHAGWRVEPVLVSYTDIRTSTSRRHSGHSHRDSVRRVFTLHTPTGSPSTTLQRMHRYHTATHRRSPALRTCTSNRQVPRPSVPTGSTRRYASSTRRRGTTCTCGRLCGTRGGGRHVGYGMRVGGDAAWPRTKHFDAHANARPWCPRMPAHSLHLRNDCSRNHSRRDDGEHALIDHVQAARKRAAAADLDGQSKRRNQSRCSAAARSVQFLWLARSDHSQLGNVVSRTQRIRRAKAQHS